MGKYSTAPENPSKCKLINVVGMIDTKDAYFLQHVKLRDQI